MANVTHSSARLVRSYISKRCSFWATVFPSAIFAKPCKRHLRHDLQEPTLPGLASARFVRICKRPPCRNLQEPTSPALASAILAKICKRTLCHDLQETFLRDLEAPVLPGFAIAFLVRTCKRAPLLPRTASAAPATTRKSPPCQDLHALVLLGHATAHLAGTCKRHLAKTCKRPSRQDLFIAGAPVGRSARMQHLGEQEAMRVHWRLGLTIVVWQRGTL